MIEEFISGTEVTCSVLDDKALPSTEIIPKSSPFFDFQAKYTAGASEEITPARLSDDVQRRVQEVALRAHHIIGCRGFSRTDMIIKNDTIYVLETNTIPGLTETSLLPQAAAAAGIAFPELLDRIISAALRDHGSH